MSHIFRLTPRDSAIELPELAQTDAPGKEPRSYWVHEGIVRAASRGEEDEDLCGKSHWFWGCGTVLFCIVLIATLAGILGTKAAHSTPSNFNATLPGEPPFNQGNNGKDSDNASYISIHPRSPLAAASIADATTSFKALAFHDVHFDIVVIEWHDTDASAYMLKSRMKDDDDEPPRPLEGASIRLVTHGSSKDLHMFYIDEDHSIIHLVQAVKYHDKDHQDNNTWRRQKFVTKSGQDGQVASGLRLTTASFPRLDYKSFPEELGVLYQVDSGDDSSLTLATNSDPSRTDTWNTTSVKLTAIGETANLTADSRELVVLPLNATVATGPARALRIIWNKPIKDHQDPLGMMECFLGQSQKIMKDCLQITEWKDASARKHLATANPVQLIEPPMHSYNTMNVDSFLLPVLDAQGRLSEVYWDGGAWSSHNDFTIRGPAPAVVKSPFTSVSITKGNTLFAVADGKLLEFTRLGKWWESAHAIEPGWVFLGVFNITISGQQHKGRMAG